MLDYSDLTIVNNKGNPSALGIPINSMFLKNDMSLIGGGKQSNSKKNKGKKEKVLNKTLTNTIVTSDNEYDNDMYDDNYDDLAVPVGLACMTQTVCRNVNEVPREQTYDHVDDNKVVPDDLYERLLGLAEESKPKKFTKKIKKTKNNRNKNNKTKKVKGKGKK